MFIVLIIHLYYHHHIFTIIVDYVNDNKTYFWNCSMLKREFMYLIFFSTCLTRMILKFEFADVSSNPDLNTNESKGVPLLLILGYGNGVQVWNIAVKIVVSHYFCSNRANFCIRLWLPVKEYSISNAAVCKCK